MIGIKNMNFGFGTKKFGEKAVTKVTVAEKKQVIAPVVLSNEKTSLQPEAVLADSKVKAAMPAKVSIINTFNEILENAYARRASDIHIDPSKNEVSVRLRVDGVLQDSQVFSKNLHAEIISRIKILSGLRIDEHQAAQDGRFRWNENLPSPVDVRVSIVPTYYGENAVMRLLSDQSADYNLEALGFSPENRDKILHAAKKPYGMILATGPTGSGKTTTLYTLIRMLNSKEVSIVTIEDPIEYSLEGINQMQVNARTNLTFANGLRSILRQDPNIIMVGEIRDHETAGLAVNTALTGHLLFSTLHTNDASTTLPRLLDLNIEPYLIASTVNVAIGQRLLRKICSSCRAEKTLSAEEAKSLAPVLGLKKGAKPPVFYRGAGCEACNFSGYMGRVGVHEVLLLDQVIRDAILRKATASDIQQLAVRQGMITMFQDGLEKAQAGITTVEEVLRMLYE